jgi:hypothetical protein
MIFSDRTGAHEQLTVPAGVIEMMHSDACREEG